MTVQFNEALFRQLVDCGFPVRGRFHRLPTADLLCQEIVKINPYLKIRFLPAGYFEAREGFEAWPKEGMQWGVALADGADYMWAPTLGEALCLAYIQLRSPKD